MKDPVAAVTEVLPSVHEDLRRLIEIPSISADPAHDEHVRASAEFVADRLRELGAEVEIVAEGGKPAVIGRFPAPAGAPTVTLYAHHDVQPTGVAEQWSTPPFDPAERGERLFGRGAADDKGGIGVHLAALRAFDGKPPVGVTVFVEGEEEIGSPSLDRIFTAHGSKLACDLFVIADSGNWEVGVPTFTTSLRGMADFEVEVATLDHGLHSGQYGGLVPDALMALTRVLSSLHDDAGNVAVAGLVSGPEPELDYPDDRLRAETGVLEGVQFIGDGTASQRMWTKPSLTVIGIDTTDIAHASNTLIPSARAKLCVRLAPGDEPDRALDRIEEHLRANAPWGARIRVERGAAGEPCELPLSGPYAEAARSAYAEAWGAEPVEMGMGGSIPLARAFQKLHPDAMILATAVVDPDSRMHGIDESLHLGDFSRACAAEALLLARLGEA